MKAWLLCLGFSCLFTANALADDNDYVVNGIAYTIPDINGTKVTFTDPKYSGNVEVPRFVDLPAPEFWSNIVHDEANDADLKWVLVSTGGYSVTFCGNVCPILRVYFKGPGKVKFVVFGEDSGTIIWGLIDQPFSDEGGSLQGSGDALFEVPDDGRAHFAEFSGISSNGAGGKVTVMRNPDVVPGGAKAQFEVTEVGDSAFRQCKQLTSVILPPTIREIGKQAFTYCNKLQSLTISSTNPPDLVGNDVFNLSGNQPQPTEKPTLYVPNDLLEYYKSRTIYTDRFDISAMSTPTLSAAEILPKVGGEVQLSIEDLEEGLTVSWTSSDESVATVDENGKVTAIKVGHCTVTATADIYVLTCEVNVMPYAGIYRDENGTLRVESITFNDADHQSYTNPYDIEAETLTYTRSFSNTGWQALYVPFNISYDEWKDLGDVAKFNGMHQYDKDKDGVLDYTVVEFDRMTSGSIKPHTPYVFKPKQDGEASFVCSNKHISAAPEQGGAILECSSTSMTYTMAGNYLPMSGDEVSGIYCLSGGTFMHVAEGAVLQPMRIYITITPKPNAYDDDPSQASLPARINISVDGEEAGLDLIMMPDQEGDGQLYDLMGRPAGPNPAPGIYIRNSKKILLR